MSTALPTPDAALVARFSGGDENALTSLFRQQYDALLKVAQPLLGDELAHAGGRIAEKAMLDAWQERSRISDAAGLTAFLMQAVHDEVAVQKRKHASLHSHSATASHKPPPDVEEAVKQLLATLHAPSVSHEEAQAQARAARRSMMKHNVESVSARPRWVLPLLGLIAVAVGFFFVQRWIGKAGADVAVDRALKGEDVQNLSSGRGQRGTLNLRDGTVAALGSDSRLRIPAEFGSTMRTLQLEGASTFTVAPDSSAKPMAFAVRAGDATITSKGTVFSVRYYPDDSTVYVQVGEGSVEVRNRVHRSNREVKAGEAIAMKSDGTITPLDGAARDAVMAWARDSIVFENTPLRLVVPELVRWFGLDAELADASIGDRPVTMRVGLTSSGDATKALTQAAGLAITFGKNDRIEFRDSSAVPAASGKR